MPKANVKVTGNIVTPAKEKKLKNPPVELKHRDFSGEDFLFLTKDEYNRYVNPSPKVAHLYIEYDNNNHFTSKQFKIPNFKNDYEIKHTYVKNAKPVTKFGAKRLIADAMDGTKMIAKRKIDVTRYENDEKYTGEIWFLSPENTYEWNKKDGTKDTWWGTDENISPPEFDDSLANNSELHQQRIKDLERLLQIYEDSKKKYFNKKTNSEEMNSKNQEEIDELADLIASSQIEPPILNIDTDDRVIKTSTATIDRESVALLEGNRRFRYHDQNTVMGNNAINEVFLFMIQHYKTISKDMWPLMAKCIEAAPLLGQRHERAQYRPEHCHVVSHSAHTKDQVEADPRSDGYDGPQRADNLGAAPKALNTKMMTIERIWKWHALNREDVTMFTRPYFNMIPNSHIVYNGEINATLDNGDRAVKLAMPLASFTKHPIHSKITDIAQGTFVTQCILNNTEPFNPEKYNNIYGPFNPIAKSLSATNDFYNLKDGKLVTCTTEYNKPFKHNPNIIKNISYNQKARIIKKGSQDKIYFEDGRVVSFRHSNVLEDNYTSEASVEENISNSNNSEQLIPYKENSKAQHKEKVKLLPNDYDILGKCTTLKGSDDDSDDSEESELSEDSDYDSLDGFIVEDNAEDNVAVLEDCSDDAIIPPGKRRKIAAPGYESLASDSDGELSSSGRAYTPGYNSLPDSYKEAITSTNIYGKKRNNGLDSFQDTVKSLEKRHS